MSLMDGGRVLHPDIQCFHLEVLKSFHMLDMWLQIQPPYVANYFDSLEETREEYNLFDSLGQIWNCMRLDFH